MGHPVYSEKATKFYEISTLLFTLCTVVKNKGEISQNFVAFSEYINFNKIRKDRKLAFDHRLLKLIDL